jgi:hypothetical protein
MDDLEVAVEFAQAGKNAAAPILIGNPDAIPEFSAKLAFALPCHIHESACHEHGAICRIGEISADPTEGQSGRQEISIPLLAARPMTAQREIAQSCACLGARSIDQVNVVDCHAAIPNLFRCRRHCALPV